MKYVNPFVAGFVAFLIIVLSGHDASAHVLVTSSDGSRSAIVHIIPDDDPIAGKVATIMFDAQRGLLDDGTSVGLTITNEATGKSEKVDSTIDKALISSKYTFPVQGVYRLSYGISTYQGKVSFEHDIRVTRGVSVGDQQKPHYAWAEAVMIGSIIAVLILIICIWNFRREIFQSSRL